MTTSARHVCALLVALVMVGPMASHEVMAARRGQVVKGDGSLPATWRVFGPGRGDAKDRGKAAIGVEALNDVPETITLGETTLTGQTVTATDGQLDFGDLFGGFKEGDVAYAFAVIRADEPTTMTIGGGGDWWMQWWLNGERIVDTTKRGNRGWPLRVTDHRVNVKLVKGENVLCVRVIAGSNSFTLKMGGPDDIRKRLAEVEQERERRRLARLAGLQWVKDQDVVDPFGSSKAEGAALISTIGSERATSGFGNKILTHKGKTYLVWQDVSEMGYFNRVRSYDHATGKWTKSIILNRGKDNHARPVLTMDHQGYLHAIMSGHGSPVTYRRSVRPYDASEWGEEQPAGSGTYPIVVCGPDDTLYLTVRSSKGWDGIDMYVKPPNGKWKFQCKLVERDKTLPAYAGFANGLAWGPDGVLHMVNDFYESKGTYDQRGVHQAVCYMRSPDGGQTWQKADGTPIKLPARPEQMDVFVRDRKVRHERIPPPDMLAQGNIVVDSKGTPHVLYVSHQAEPGEVVFATPDAKGVWQRRKIEAMEKAYPEMRVVSCRGALTITEDDTIIALLDMFPLDHGWKDGKPTRAMRFRDKPVKRLVWLTSTDLGKTFTVRTVFEPGSPQGGFNEPCVERPTGVNTVPAGATAPMVYFDGTSRYAKKGEILQNNVYFVPTSRD